MILWTAVLAGLCTPPEPAATPDPEDAAAYAAEGDEARAAGDVRIAAVAYRKAIAADPHNPRAAAALAELCAADARPSAPSVDDELAAAIALVGRGELDRARAALEAVLARDPGSAGAEFFLGLIALRRHDGGEAQDHFERAARDPGYADVAASMARLAFRDGRIAITLLGQGEYDSNPQLVPGTPPAGATVGPPKPDDSLTLGATIVGRPARWLVVRDTLAWRNLRTQSALDFIGENAQLGVELDRGADHVAIRYDLDYDVLGGNPYLIANRGAAVYRRDLGDVSLEASYSLRGRSYRRAAEAGFSGTVHAGELATLIRATPQLDLEARVFAHRELTSDVTFSVVELGGQVVARARPHPRVRAMAIASGWTATYDGAEPDGALRRDQHATAGLDLEIDLADLLIAVGGMTYDWNGSSVEDFRYRKLVVRLGLAVAFGAP